MVQLFKFEFKKIVNRKVNLITMALGLLLIVVSNVLLIYGESLSNEEGAEIKGVGAIIRLTEMENSLTSELSEEFLAKFLKKYQKETHNKSFEENYFLIESNINLISFIAANYSEWNEQWDWDDLHKVNTDNGINFYERRLEKIKNRLNSEYTFGNYTEIEKNYWLKKAESVSTPFVWGSKTTWNIIWTSIKFLFFQCFVISICLAPIFAGEYQNRTDSLLLSSKHGRNKLICAKIVAAFAFSFFYIVLCSFLSVGMNLVLLGIEGWNLPVQLWDSAIPYDLQIVEVCGLNLLIMLLISFLLTSLMLMFSTICKSQMIALAINILLFFGTIFLPFSKTSWLWNHIIYLCPAYTFDFKTILSNYVSYPVGNIVISYLNMIFIIYMLIILICLYCAGINFKKHQIGK